MVSLSCVSLHQDVSVELPGGLEGELQRDGVVVGPMEHRHRDVEDFDGVGDRVTVEVLGEALVDDVAVVHAKGTVDLCEQRPVLPESEIVGDGSSSDDGTDAAVVGVEGYLRAEPGAEENARPGIEVLEDRPQVRKPGAQRRLGEGDVGLGAVPEVEPDRSITLLDRAGASTLVAPGLVAAEAVTEDYPFVVRRCRLDPCRRPDWDGVLRRPLGHPPLVSCVRPPLCPWGGAARP